MWVEILMKHVLPSKRCINAAQNIEATCSDITAATTISFWHKYSFHLSLFNTRLHTQLNTLWKATGLTERVKAVFARLSSFSPPLCISSISLSIEELELLWHSWLLSLEEVKEMPTSNKNTLQFCILLLCGKTNSFYLTEIVQFLCPD